MAIEEVKSEPFIDAKLVITPARIPLGTIMGEIADAMDSTKKNLDRYKQVTVMQPLRDLKEDINQWKEEELADLKKVADAHKNANLWSSGHFISSASYATLSILFGLYLIVIKGEDGEKFVYGGSTLLANTFLMDYFGGWTALSRLASFGNQTVEQTLKVTLPLATTLMTMIYSAHNLASLPPSYQDIVKTIDKLMSWVNMIVQVGNIYTKWIKGQAERQLMVVQGQITALTMKIEPLNLRNENLTNLAKQVNDAIKGGIKKIIKGTSAIPMGAV
jgi:hypothetical protein